MNAYGMRSSEALHSRAAAAAARHNPCCCHATPCRRASDIVAISSSKQCHALFDISASTSSYASNPSIRAASQHRCRPAAAANTAAVTAPAASTIATPPVKLPPEVKARHKRPEGWTAPGPSPVGLQDSAASAADTRLRPQANETLSYLTGDWRIFQLKDGHRWSMDDMMTAYVALQEAAAINQAAAAGSPTSAVPAGGIRHTLDIGCGIGSVLLMVAWGLRRQHMEQQQQQQQQQGVAEQQQQQQQQLASYSIKSCGVEAQAVSFQLAQRSIRYNLGCSAQQLVQVINQDLRQPLPWGHSFQLVTGTPPYIPEGAGGRSDRPQKAPCCLETRGGIEDYCSAAAAALAPGGVFVVCGGIQGQPARFKGRRAQLAAAAAGLVIVRQVTVVTREGKPPLFAVYVMRKAEEVLQEQQHWMQQQQGWLQDQQQAQDVQQSFEQQVTAGQLNGCELFVVQHADGSHSQAWHEVRAAMGLPPLR